MKQWFSEVGTALSALLNAVSGGKGRQTLSARCNSATCGPCLWICNLLDRFWPGHCARAAKE